ncbi:MAG: DUF2219 family protein [Caulobacteraceae bacterium]|nr:DUF2219 family protein [Caulobacteraceae bacterium]
MRRSGKGIAALAASAVLGGLCGASLFMAWTSATADAIPDDLDEAIRTAPETNPDFSAVPIQPEAAQTVAIAAPRPPAAIEYAQASSVAVNAFAQASFRQAGQTMREYEPRVQFASTRGDNGSVRNEISLGLTKSARARRPAAPAGSNGLNQLRNSLEPSRDIERRGRWILFASDDQQAVGLNLLRSRDGELRRMSWTTDRVATVGDAQVGVGWRRGAFQASLALVDREISIYGKSRDERFLAFTISIKPRNAAADRRRDRMQPEAYAPRANPH